MYFHVYLIYRFTRTFTDHSSVITRCWGFELQNGKSSLKSPQTLATQDFAPASFLSTPDRRHLLFEAGVFVLLAFASRPLSKKKRVYGRNMVPFPGANCAGGPVLFDRLGRRKNRLPVALRRSRGGQIARGPLCGAAMAFPQKRPRSKRGAVRAVRP